MIAVLLPFSAGADPAISDSMQQLPLHYACIGGHKECVRLILDHHLLGLRGLRLATHYVEEVSGQHGILRLLQEASRKRQRELVAPQLFEAAVTGNCSKLYEVIDDGDDVNPLVNPPSPLFFDISLPNFNMLEPFCVLVVFVIERVF